MKLSDRSKIVHLISTLDVGGAEIQLAKLLGCNHLSSFQHSVVSLVPLGPIGERIRKLGIPVYSLGMKRSVPSMQAVWRLWGLLWRERPQVLQSWLYHANLLGLLVCKAAGVPHIVWNVRSSSMEMRHYPWLSGAVYRILPYLSSAPEVVVYNSQAGRDAHAAMGYRPKRAEVIPNGFELERFRPESSARDWLVNECRLPQDAAVVGLVARADPMKDHETFFRAARLVRSCRPNVYFVLCGTNIDMKNSALTRHIRENRLDDYVRLLGLRHEVERITAALDIACSCSAFGEGCPNAIGEAMACGVPCVVTDVGDSAYMVGKTGGVVPPRDPNAFAEALVELIDCGDQTRKKLGLQARARIAERFDIRAIALRYHDLYQSLLTP